MRAPKFPVPPNTTTRILDRSRVVAIAREKQIVRGRRVDTTVGGETDIHYPTDSSLLGDGVRVLTRSMQRVAKLAGRAGTKLRHRTRTVRYRVMEIARASRSSVAQGVATGVKISFTKSRRRLENPYTAPLNTRGRALARQ